jgi:hypothetical protein
MAGALPKAGLIPELAHQTAWRGVPVEPGHWHPPWGARARMTVRPGLS